MYHKCIILLAVACCIAFVSAGVVDFSDELVLARPVRSPQGGSVQLGYNQDGAGKRGSVEYNHNLHTSSDGRFKVDAYAQGQRDFTHNRNDYGGGVRGSWKF